MDLENKLSNGVIRPNPFGWVLTLEEIEVVEAVATHIRGGGGGGFGGIYINNDRILDLSKEQPEKYKDFIRVVCKVNDIEYDEVKYRDTETLVTVEEVKMTLESVLNVKVHLLDK